MNWNDEREILKKLGIGVITFTGSLVVLLALGIAVSVFSRPDDLDEIKSYARAPSSIQNVSDFEQLAEKGITGYPSFQEDKSRTISLGCIQNGKKIEINSSVRQVRIRGSICSKKSLDWMSSNLVNRANGFEATFFKIQNDSFSTDYITLNEGVNQMLLQVEGSKGFKATQDITIHNVKSKN
ncbi:MAG: hypothetical protein ABL927_01830 [Bdellovibrionales bacterium]